MQWMIASDLHGSAYYARALAEAFAREGADRLVLLGDLLYHGLTGMGYTCVEPGGTFYLMVKSPEPDAAAFCERAKRYDLLFPPTDDFHCPGWCRIAFCTATETVQKALPLFKKLAAEYGLN